MARLPDVGYRPIDLRASRPSARIDATPIAEGEAALAGALGRGGEALARALQQSGDIGRILQEAGGAQGRTVMEVGERVGRGIRKAGTEAGTAVAEGGNALAKATREAGAAGAKGAAAFAAGLESIGKAVHDIKERHDKFTLASALSQFENGVTQVAGRYDQDRDYPTLVGRYKRDVDALRNDIGARIDPSLRQAFALGSQGTVERTTIAAQRLAHKGMVDERERASENTLNELVRSAGTADGRGIDGNPTAKIDRANALIQARVDIGDYTPEQARARRNKWLDDYGTAWAAAQPLGQLAELIQKKREGGETRRTPLDYVSLYVTTELHKRATVEASEEKRRLESQAALERQELRRQLDQDIRDINATGRGIGGLDTEAIERVLGPAARQRWQEAREDAHAVRANLHDLSTLPEPQIEARIATLRLEAEISHRHSAIHAKVKQHADLIRGLRRTDPARSVNDDPAVLAATQALDLARLETFQPLADARLAAQERAGIPKGQRSVITRSEALSLTAPLARARPDQEQDVWNETARRFHAMFGTYGEAALADALRVRQMKLPSGRLRA